MTEQVEPQFTSRILKVGCQYYESRAKEKDRRFKTRQVPYLRLCGDWLEAAGLKVGQNARVIVTRRGIVIAAEE
ncbi:MAG TPA: type I toxin-antitoxin system SymE family toxin [Stenotrophomonas sp.]|uniref:SymE family type I addiction module toxin n=1 Tax=Stenotrophomonas acidaminiphila TaxID=128780 RepID=UPI000E8FBEF6|nr:SymE family type I addiction module toxin [Stenotrophomonas acidaminiphila]HBN52707.1 type I toxin-antitoxin system SymE family toxin [Stenotrophomonas sp.]